MERLQEAAAEGRIDFAELDTRLEKALGAKTQGELAPLTADLPSVPDPREAEPLVLKGGMHGVRRTGPWQVPPRITAHGGMAGVVLDFTMTTCRLPEVQVEAHGEMAGVVIIIPEGWAADTYGVQPGLGAVRDKTTPERRPGTPMIRVTGTGGTAGVVVRHLSARELRKLERKKTR